MRFVAASPELARHLALDPGCLEAAGRPGAVALIDEGRVLAIGGLSEVAPHRALAWLVTAPGLQRRHWGRIVSFMRRRLAVVTYARIEAAVVADGPCAIAFAERLGFVREGLMGRYMADGRPAWLMAWLRPAEGAS